MRVLVTGGAGFIGSHVVDRLRRQGTAVRVLDLRKSSYHRARDVEHVGADLLDLRAVERAVNGCDAVIHLAAAADVDDVARRPAEAEAVNARGTLNVLEAARRTGVRRVVYASTIWVYGNGSGTVDEDSAVVLPDHLYTATKLAGEMYCRAYSELYGLQCTVLRFGIPYGPRARPAGVIPIFVTKALAGEPLTIAGEGSQSRRFVYVEDLADGVVRGLERHAIGRVYNLVGDQSVTVRQIAQTVGELVGDVGVVPTPGRTADFQGAEVCGARAAAELGWQPRTTFTEGVRRYVEWRRAPEPAPAAKARPVVRLSPRLVRFALTCLVAIAVAGALGAYLASVRAIGLTMAEDRTVAVLSLAMLAGYVAMVIDGSYRTQTTFVGWALVATGLVVVYMPELRETLRLAGPDESRVLLGLAGGALAIGLADAGLRLRRTGEEFLAADAGG
jgi:UDP-glucose 4-epimerase